VYGEEQDEGWEASEVDVDESFFAVDDDDFEDDEGGGGGDLEGDIQRWKAQLGLATDATQVQR